MRRSDDPVFFEVRAGGASAGEVEDPLRAADAVSQAGGGHPRVLERDHRPRPKDGRLRTQVREKDPNAKILIVGDFNDDPINSSFKKVLNTKLRFKDEFARHKILDILGDFYLLGKPIRGKIKASKSGHTQNVGLLKKIRDSLIEKN